LAQEQADNSLTLLLTSQPHRRPFNATHVGAQTIDEINTAIQRLEASDSTANLDSALKELEDYLSSQPPNINRVVYIFTDLRRRDWKENDDNSQAPAKVVSRLSKLTQRCYVIDVADDDDLNLTITDLRAEGTLVQGVQSALDVTVANQGTSDARDVRVKFSAGESLPIETTIERLAAGQASSVRFNFTFSGDEQADDPARLLPPRQVKVELLTAQQAADDRLLPDSVAYFPARLVRGIPTLVIDGDPSADFGRAESFYLRRALAPVGAVPSGVVADIVTENELESLALDKYQVIFLLNNYRLGEKTAENIQRLEKWVAAGGGLVIMPGDQIDEQFYNAQYWRDGAGLSPLKLENIRGDESEKTWATLRVEDATHEVLKQFAGQNNPLLENVKAFRWWGASVKREQLGKEISLIARFSDVEDSPAIVEKAFGKGRVVAFSIPADSDWHNWPSDPSYLLIVQDFVRYLAADRGNRGLLRVGEPIRQPVDLTQYELDATLTGPRELKANLQAAQPSSASATTDQPTVWHIEYPAAPSQGCYELKLTRRDGGTDILLFAANVDPTEGDLKRADRQTLEREWVGTNVQILSAAQGQALADSGTQTEIWWYLLWTVVAVLSCEQLLGWFFGRGRS
jgi:CARDB protein